MRCRILQSSVLSSCQVGRDVGRFAPTCSIPNDSFELRPWSRSTRLVSFFSSLSNSRRSRFRFSFFPFESFARLSSLHLHDPLPLTSLRLPDFQSPNMVHVKASLIALSALASQAYAAAASVNTPTSLIQCQPYQLSESRPLAPPENFQREPEERARARSLTRPAFPFRFVSPQPGPRERAE